MHSGGDWPSDDEDAPQKKRGRATETWNAGAAPTSAAPSERPRTRWSAASSVRPG